jgi:glycosyltransferase involved in cell wall biosynthesis
MMDSLYKSPTVEYNWPPDRALERATEEPVKLIVQIPVLDEADSIAGVLADIPRDVPGIASVEVLIVDDGCTDNTVAIALAHGADHVVRHTSRKGLATAFQTGIDTALRLGADIIVNTDGDHQYPGAEIPRLIAPILAGQADYVIGDRQVDSIEHFSPLKKTLQAIGSGVVRWASETEVSDAVSGFRALSREAALRTFVTSDFSYTVENLIQAGKKRLTVATIPIATNLVERPSRLHRGNWNFIKQQGATIVRTYVTYEPLKTFTYLAAPFLLVGVLLLGRAIFVYIMRQLINDYPQDNFQSLVGGGVALMLGFLIFLFGILADRIGGIRRLLDEVLYRARAHEVADEEWRRSISARLDQLEQTLLEDGLGIERKDSARERG